ncbi:MAG: dihydrodipicolinate synthase family protein [Planctomycetes bacterium]|nr:dihydrodipicolinate synthase family protein [Planctomycetota bacterium]
MNHNKEKLSGVFAPVVTPFEGDQPDLDALAFNLTKLRQTDLTGFLALGSNGEVKSLTDEERLLVLEVFAREKGDKVVMVGTGCESTKETIEKSHVAAQMGFDYVSLLTPHYHAKQMDGAALRRYYERVAEAVSVPVLLYNAPQFAGGVQIPPRTIVELAAHPNIVGIKDSSATGPGRFLAELDPEEDFSVLAGGINFFYASLHAGAVGGVLSLANVVPEACTEVYDLFMKGMYDRARELSAGLIRLNQFIAGAWGVAGVKAAMDLIGLRGGRPREPLMPVPTEGIAQIRQALVTEGFPVFSL